MSETLKPTAEFGCTPDGNRDYVRIYVTPKGEDARGYRLSRGGAEVLAAEIAGSLTRPTPGEDKPRELLEAIREALNGLSKMEEQRVRAAIEAYERAALSVDGV